MLAYGVLPALALLLAAAAGFLKWQDNSVREAEIARIESVQAAKDTTIALLSYKPDTVEQQLGAARDLLTGDFRDSYTALTNDVVIPGAKEKQISAVATRSGGGLGVGRTESCGGSGVRQPDAWSSAPTRPPTPRPACGSRWTRSTDAG